MTALEALADVEPTVRALAARYAPPADRDDLAQVGRLAAWQAWASFDGRGSLTGRMAVKARWAMIDHLRTHGPHGRTGLPRHATAVDIATVPPAADPAPGPEQVVCARADVAEAAVWLAGLPARTADAVVLPPGRWAARWGRHPSRASQLRGQALAERQAA